MKHARRFLRRHGLTVAALVAVAAALAFGREDLARLVVDLVGEIPVDVGPAADTDTDTADTDTPEDP